jgi:hypothetical protein
MTNRDSCRMVCLALLIGAAAFAGCKKNVAAALPRPLHHPSRYRDTIRGTIRTECLKSWNAFSLLFVNTSIRSISLKFCFF